MALKKLIVLLVTLTTLTLITPSTAPVHGQAGVVRRVNAPFFSGVMDNNQAAIFWFGRVTSTENYADVRVGYTPVNLYIRLDIFDRFLWYDTTPSAGDLPNWDAATLVFQSGWQRWKHPLCQFLPPGGTAQ